MKGITVDFVMNTINVTEAFFKAAAEIGSEEYTTLRETKTENPQMRVVIHKANAKNRHNSTKGLSYRYMRKFISLLDCENLGCFDKVMMHYEGLGFDNLTVYQYVKDWFLENYPNHKNMIVDAAPKRLVS